MFFVNFVKPKTVWLKANLNELSSREVGNINLAKGTAYCMKQWFDI
jgi:hypothetical protein